MTPQYIVYGPSGYVCAPPGWCRTKSGKLERDGSPKGGPEWTCDYSKAFRFDSLHRAKLIANRGCGKVMEAQW